LAIAAVQVNAAIAPLPPDVTPPTVGTPDWWNSECTYYAYGYWDSALYPGNVGVSPSPDAQHWASNFEGNTSFTASIPTDDISNILSINLGNIANENLEKEIYIYIKGTTAVEGEGNITQVFDTDGGTFLGFYGGDIEAGQWDYILSGKIIPQLAYETLDVTVPGLTSVTNIWAGTNCIPEPATICLLGIGALSLIRRKK
jgi:hypothetical protein